METPFNWPDEEPKHEYVVLETELTWPVRRYFPNFDSAIEFTSTLKKPYSIIDKTGTIYCGNTEPDEPREPAEPRDHLKVRFDFNRSATAEEIADALAKIRIIYRSE
jgi:hypothetical protein